MMAATRQERVKRAISNYCVTLRYIHPEVSGKDLLKMGVVPGPIYREILQSLRNEKVNGLLKTRDDEMQYVTRRLMSEDISPFRTAPPPVSAGCRETNVQAVHLLWEEKR
jgi:hypothetical protein